MTQVAELAPLLESGAGERNRNGNRDRGLLAKRSHAPSPAGGQAKAPPARVAPDAAAAAEATRIEERLKGREQAVETRAAEIAERERRLAEKEGQITELRDQAVRQL